jgi:hypothetical protein
LFINGNTTQHNTTQAMSAVGGLYVGWGYGEYVAHTSTREVGPTNTLPVLFDSSTAPVRSLSCGATHTVAIIGPRCLLVWGDGSAGQYVHA